MKKKVLAWLVGISIIAAGLAIYWKSNLNQLEEGARTMNQPNRSITSIQNDVLSKGDTNAYLELRTAYLDYSPEEFLFWALIMANKYEYPPAYLDVYYTLLDAYCCDVSTGNLDKMDRKTREIALNYLKAAAEKGNEQAKQVWEQHYGEGRTVVTDGKSRKK